MKLRATDPDVLAKPLELRTALERH